MKVLSKHTTLLQYSIDVDYFKSHSKLKSLQHTSSHWTLRDGYNYLQYDVTFQAKDPTTGDYFVNFHNRLNLQCVIDVVDDDAKEIIKYKEIVNVSSQLFLMNNTQDFYDLLDFREMNFKDIINPHENPSRENSIEREINQIKRSMAPLTF